MKTVPVPPAYTPAEMARRELLLAGIADLMRHYQEKAGPLIAEVAAIEARYAPRVAVVREKVETTR